LQKVFCCAVNTFTENKIQNKKQYLIENFICKN
jgi:hypothetical protein